MTEISVIIPAHNPRRDFLDRVLAALRGQTVPLERWELLLVDNASKIPLDTETDLSWHPQARIVREDVLGLTSARVRGFAEARGCLHVLVDDDNVLQPDYLEHVLKIAVNHPNLGAWSGQVLPEFEISPPAEIAPFLNVLCIRKLAEDHWGNSSYTGLLPYGAGMCVRKAVADRYAINIASDSIRAGLDRKGESLTSSGDLDLAWTSLDLEMGTGLFRDLVVTHLIPSRRLAREYILRIIEDSCMGYHVLQKVRGSARDVTRSGIDDLVAAYKLWRATPMQKEIHAARLRGEQRAKAMFAADPEKGEPSRIPLP